MLKLFWNCLVDGGWGSWTNWTSCSSGSCAAGTSYRYRACDSPPPSNGYVIELCRSHIDHFD